MCIELKIKAKHLALEPKIIKHEERKLKGQIKYTKGTDANLIYKLNDLVNHRKWNVRNESRATELARAYLAGKPYSYVEKKRKDTQNLKDLAENMAECATNIQGQGYASFIASRENFLSELEKFRRCWTDFLYK